jgi:hypothetical protein
MTPPPGRTCGAQRCRMNPVGAVLGRVDLPVRFASRKTSMARMSEAEAGTLSNSNASRKASRPAPDADIALAEALIKHVRKTSLARFPHSAPFRHGLSIMFWRQISAGIGVEPRLTEIRCFPSPSKSPRCRPENRKLLIFLRPKSHPFQIRPLMRTRWPFR